MQAVILSGGQGTRLRPLTATMPKPSVPMVNRPMIWYMIDWLRGHGVSEVVMSVGFLADGLRAALDATGHEGVNIRYVEEPEPLGTAGAVKFAEQHLDERFLVLNGDVLTDFDIGAEIAQHAATGARATLALVPVEDPTAYGLVLTDEQKRIEAFLEKPDAADVPPNPRINAGAYVLERDVLQMIPAGENKSFEHDVFPQLVGDGIYAYDADGYWLDLGTPERYVEATRDLLDNKARSYLSGEMSTSRTYVGEGAEIVLGPELEKPFVVGEDAKLAAGVALKPYSVIGQRTRIAANCVVDAAVIMHDCEVGEGATISQALIGPGVQIGTGARVEPGAVIGEGARIEANAVIAADARVDANAAVAA
ncbi:MAG: sugar phosphate nucleotidyltransferase [Solirubrobacterales bacterium]